MIKVSHLVACPMVFNLLCHLLSIIRRLGPFPQVFGRMKESLIS